MNIKTYITLSTEYQSSIEIFTHIEISHFEHSGFMYLSRKGNLSQCADLLFVSGIGRGAIREQTLPKEKCSQALP